MSLGFTEILVIVSFVVLVFGAKRIPELAKALGRASREFKKARDAIDREGEELTGEKVDSEAREAGTGQPASAATAAKGHPAGPGSASSKNADVGGQ